MAWDTVCTPKNIGGLGVRSMDYFNNGCLTKLGSKVLTNNTNWWVKSKAYIFELRNFWKIKSDKITPLLEGLRWRVGH